MWQELKTRWKAESPIFWRNVLKIAVFFGTAATALLGADAVWDLQSSLHPLIFVIAKYIIAVCATLGLSAKITKQ